MEHGPESLAYGSVCETDMGYEAAAALRDLDVDIGGA